jgi:hypothetical protein
VARFGPGFGNGSGDEDDREFDEYYDLGNLFRLIPSSLCPHNISGLYRLLTALLDRNKEKRFGRFASLIE